MSSLSHKKKGDGLCHLLKSLLSSYVGIIQIRFPGRSSQLPLSLFTSSPVFYFFSINFSLFSVKINLSTRQPLSDHPQSSENIQPGSDGKSASQCSQHNHAGSQRSLMIHIFRHHIAAYCSSRTQHDQNGYQLFLAESHSCRQRKEQGTKSCQLQKRGIY